MLAVESEILERLLRRSQPADPARLHRLTLSQLSHEQGRVAELLCGCGPLIVVEGAAGAGKTRTLAAVSRHLARRGRRLLVVTPTLKAAEVAARETGATTGSVAALLHQHGWRWDDDGHWTRQPIEPSAIACLRRTDLLLIDEAGMIDQDTALALLTIADEAGARVAFVGDRHQLPAVGRGGVLDHVIAWAHPSAVVSMQEVRRFADPEYARLSLAMRDGRRAGAVFDRLVARDQVRVHASKAERIAALAAVGADGALVVADTREHVATLNAAIRTKHLHESNRVATDRGELIGVGDRVATRRNDPCLCVANRQTWTVVGTGDDGSLIVHSPGHGRDRALPTVYVREHVELTYATRIYGAQGETVDHARVAIGETTEAAAAYVAMTKGRQTNVAHLVAESVEDARKQWIDVLGRDRADLGPAHARGQALEAVDRYGPAAMRRTGIVPPPTAAAPSHVREPGIGL